MIKNRRKCALCLYMINKTLERITLPVFPCYLSPWKMSIGIGVKKLIAEFPNIFYVVVCRDSSDTSDLMKHVKLLVFLLFPVVTRCPVSRDNDFFLSLWNEFLEERGTFCVARNFVAGSSTDFYFIDSFSL